jgi:hypothetical protein
MNHILDIIGTGITTAFVIWLMAKVGLFPYFAIILKEEDDKNSN